MIASPTSTLIPTPSATATVPAPQAPPTYPIGAVLINEIAWAGTLAAANDEWIELRNAGPDPIDLSGWRLTDGDDIQVALSGTILGYSYFLLERTDDTTIADLFADQIYTGSLKNGGESLELTDPSGAVIDSANATGGAWPAGDSSSRASMERRGGGDSSGDWGTFTGVGSSGHDAEGNPIAGTPKNLNSPFVATPTPSPSPTPLAPQAVLINEVAWAGTSASPSDEWIELHNPGPQAISLSGWKLTDDGDIYIPLQGTIPGYGFFLLERTDDAAVADIAADLIYTGTLSNDGERLRLLGPSGELVDSANGDGGGWPDGAVESRASMERWGGPDTSSNWGTFTGYYGVGLDAKGKPIAGTPRSTNSLFYPTPVPTWIPGRIEINEVLIRPHYDWEGTGGVTTGDEFIELYNHGPGEVYLKGWWLDDIEGGGSRPYDLPGVTIPPQGFAVFFRSKSKIALNDSGDTVRLMAPNRRLIDQVSYLRVRAYNLSYGRLPDGSSHLAYGLWPTPGEPNLLFLEPIPEPATGPFYPAVCPGSSWPAGSKSARASMERRATEDNPGSWVSYAGELSLGHDADGNPIAGTPGGANSAAQDRPNDAGGASTPGASWPLISEIAWAGTRASSRDEWIELHNPGDQAIELRGWILTDGDDIHIALDGILDSGGYYLLERDDDDTVIDATADQIYSGALRDAGETLWLIDSSGRVVDTANSVRPGRPAPLLPRLSRSPIQIAWMWQLGMLTCNETG